MLPGQTSYRLYSCARCRSQVRICRNCDRGNQYCARSCAVQRRVESVRRAGARYQRTRPGARLHADRQRRWRERQPQEVTHQGSAAATVECTIPVIVIPAAVAHAQVEIAITDAVHGGVTGALRPSLCSFCGSELPRLTRLGHLRGGP
jgi:hypothetical protein